MLRMRCLTTRVYLAIVVVVAVNGCTSTEPTITMPNYSGMLLSDAKDQYKEMMAAATVDGLTMSPRTVDASPHDRTAYDQEDWTVISTHPSAGTVMEGNAKVYFFILENQEAVWYSQNALMPEIPTGVDGESLFASGGPLEGMDSLVEFRYPDGVAPPDDSYRGSYDFEDETLPIANPFTEPESETAARRALAEGNVASSTTVGSLPSAGEAVRQGQILVVTKADKPRQQVQSSDPDDDNSSSVSVDGSVGESRDNDDDFNVPGWLCPTRYC